jgi:hypothetical protein
MRVLKVRKVSLRKLIALQRGRTSLGFEMLNCDDAAEFTALAMRQTMPDDV